MRRLYIKIFNWEYWPMWVVYFPVGFYYLFLAAKARSLFFFSAANPSIETGGMFFESKWKIFKLIPKQYFPTTVLIELGDSNEIMNNKLSASAIEFPVIAKPDRGERGWGVKKISSIKELEEYKATNKIDFLIQAYVNAPLEFSVFYFREPGSSKGSITSVTLKQLLTITGDGKSTTEELIRRNDRAFLQYTKLKNSKHIQFNRILQKDEEQVLVPYGNHVLGAMFLDYNHIIDQELTDSFDIISKQINNFFYGRFDLRCNSIADLKKGRNISILELNGAGAEPAHIYQPGFSFYKAQMVLAKHYRMMYQAAMLNKKSGTSFMTYDTFKITKGLEKEYKAGIVLQ